MEMGACSQSVQPDITEATVPPSFSGRGQLDIPLESKSDARAAAARPAGTVRAGGDKGTTRQLKQCVHNGGAQICRRRCQRPSKSSPPPRRQTEPEHDREPDKTRDHPKNYTVGW
jgi:hypothetical protein